MSEFWIESSEWWFKCTRVFSLYCDEKQSDISINSIKTTNNINWTITVVSYSWDWNGVFWLILELLVKCDCQLCNCDASAGGPPLQGKALPSPLPSYGRGGGTARMEGDGREPPTIGECTPCRWGESWHHYCTTHDSECFMGLKSNRPEKFCLSSSYSSIHDRDTFYCIR